MKIKRNTRNGKPNETTKRPLRSIGNQASLKCAPVNKRPKIKKPKLTYNKLDHLDLKKGQIIRKYQVTGTILGEGTFGRVWEVMSTQTEQKFALKVVHKSTDAKKIEIQNLKRIRKLDPSGLDSLCAIMHKDIKFNGHFGLVFDVLGQSLYEFMKVTNGGHPFVVEDIQLVVSQLVHAVEFLHSRGIVHTDLKMENILFVQSDFNETKNGEDYVFRRIPNRRIKLIDFGCALFGKVGQIFQPNTSIQTALYRAIEILLGRDWTVQVDMWSIGCILYEMYYGQELFIYEDSKYKHDPLEHLAMIHKILGEIPKEMFVKGQAHLHTQIVNKQFNNPIFQAHYNNNCTTLRSRIRNSLKNNNTDAHHQLFDLMRQCLVLNDKLRITASLAVKHKLFQHLPGLVAVTDAVIQHDTRSTIQNEPETVQFGSNDIEMGDVIEANDVNNNDDKPGQLSTSDGALVLNSPFIEGQRIRRAIKQNNRASEYYNKIPKPTIPPIKRNDIPRQFEKDGDIIAERYILINEAISVLRNTAKQAHKYKVGDLVMVECEPYPYWPAIVQPYPASEPSELQYQYTKLEMVNGNREVRQFYIQYLGPLLSRIWTNEANIVGHYTGWYDLCTLVGKKLLKMCENGVHTDRMKKL